MGGTGWDLADVTLSNAVEEVDNYSKMITKS